MKKGKKILIILLAVVICLLIGFNYHVYKTLQGAGFRPLAGSGKPLAAPDFLSQNSSTSSTAYLGDMWDYFGMGTTTPQVQLDVLGDIRLGHTVATSSCVASIDGTISYSKTDQHLYICDGSAWQLIK